MAWGDSNMTNPVVMTSANARDWTVAGTPPDIVDARYEGGMWVSAGAAGIATSTDGVAWQAAPIKPAGTCGHVAGVKNGWYVSCDTQVFISPDGLAWTEAKTPDSATMGAALRDSGAWIGFAMLGTKPVVTSSPDGLTWTAGKPLPERFSGSRIVAI